MEDAKRNALKARDDAELASTALARTLRNNERIQPMSPLFVISSPIELRIPLIADTHSKLIADSVPGDRGHPGWSA